MKYPEVRFAFQCLVFLFALSASVVNCFSLDREAFSFTNYDLDVQIEPEQHRLGVRGKVILRNDSPHPQKVVILQISSSLDWRSIKAGEKAVQFVTQPYTSDIDNTGAVSEAIVTLPRAVPPKESVELEIGYEGMILLDTTRLTRIGTPLEAAKSTDWDRIGAAFTGVRGIGHVAWYPVATDVANLSEGNSLFEALGRWKAREAAATAHIKISVSRSGGQVPRLIVNEPSCIFTFKEAGEAQLIEADCNFRALGMVVPSFVLAEYGEVDRPSIHVY